MAVVADPANRVKMEFLSYHLLPDAAVLDPRMTETLPPRITAATGFDALVHAIEAATCLQRNPVSDAFAEKAMAQIVRALPRAVQNWEGPQGPHGHGQRQPAGWGGLLQLHGGAGPRHRPRPGGRVPRGPRGGYDHPAPPPS